MRLRTAPQRFNQGVIRGIQWIPLLVALQGWWLLYTIPLVTSVAATRALIEVLILLRGNDQQEVRCGQLFRQRIRHLRKRKSDWFFSGLMDLLVIDSLILGRIQLPISQMLSAGLLVIFVLCVLVLFYQTMAGWQTGGPLPQLWVSFYLFGKQPKKVLAHVLWTFCFAFVLALFGPVYLLVLGMSGWVLGNLFIYQK
ncbi:hypothetical protein [Enterococcus sp. RIT-PI-f]|uniref:hypothetical protein n=1 Tax=Enterococcus sp. RIT-PI-f TaxID=1690244 RepID=UPI0006B8DC38|nr:hypothetical protein [Enterococcus sp. RIT-PI-f]KPG70113.1 hypothetical protein AEQ18_09420 [Enterococcus sp. RIT-PI-f]